MKSLNFCVITILFAINFNVFAEEFNPPKTEIRPVKDVLHNFEFIDNYRWLEDKKDPKVLNWSKAQHQYTIDYIEKNFKKYVGLTEEIKKVYDRDYISAPTFIANREFFSKKMRGEQQYKLYTRIKGKEILIFDPMKIDTTGKSAISQITYTKKADKVAIGVQKQGNEVNTFYIIDTKKGKQIYEPIEGLAGFEWTNDEKSAYLTLRDREMLEKQIPMYVTLHKLGTKRAEDKILLKAPNMKNFVSIWDTKKDTGNNYTFISESDFWSNTLYMIKLGGKLDSREKIFSSSEYRATPNLQDGKIYFFTNYEAPNWKIMVADTNNASFENWKEFYSEKDTKLESYVFTSDYFIVHYRKDVLSKIDVYDKQGNFIKHLDLPEVADFDGLSYNKDMNTVFVSFNAVNIPTKIYKLDGKTLEWKLFWLDNIDIDVKDVVVEQKFFKSFDDTRVPIFIIHKKGTKLDGNNPTLMYGYGGFNHIVKPGFVGHYLSFLNRGGIYVLACIRGGGEYGEKWHKDGMLNNKEKSLKDFAAACEFLFEEKYTNPKRLALRAGSNGGILIGWMTLNRPDLFNAAVCAVPLLDMLRYHKFLMGPYWIPEYGDPENKEDFLTILNYSPYQNIKVGRNYPSLLIKAGENDARVDPLHAKKFAAALQNNKEQTNPIMLYIDFESGHGSGQSIDQKIYNLEMELRYVMDRIGM